MNNAIAHLFSDHLVTALSSTLIHSLWQGALLSALTGLIMTCTRHSSSARRYNLLVAAMALFAIVVAGTFIFEFNKGGVRMPVPADQYVVNHGPVLSGTAIYPAATPPSSIPKTIGSYLNKYAATIVWIWLLIVCVRCAQMLAGLRDVYNLRRKDRLNIGDYWEERVAQMGQQLGINRLIGIAQSGRIKTPVVIGYLKPLILIPIGMLASLSAEQAEAILLHELAHIRRADYLVNLLQSLMEIVFFFNPAVLWLSALIKAERENCCDDMALTRSSKVNYLKALVACEEYNQPVMAYAMALKGSNGGLKNRVARIISNKNLSLNSREKSFLAACLIAAGIFVAAFANGERIHKLVTAAHKKVAATSHKKDNLQQVKPIATPAEQVINRTAKTDEVQRDPVKQANYNYRDTDRTKSMISDLMKDGIITSAEDLSFKIGNDEFVVNYKKQPEAIHQKYRAKYVANQQNGHWDWFFQFNSQKYRAIAADEYDAVDIHKAQVAQVAQAAKEAQVAQTAKTAQVARAVDDYSFAGNKQATDDRTKSMISDLLKDGVISSPDNVSFKIGTDEFVVNYKKQPDAVYQKYRAKYVLAQKHGDWIWYSNFDTQKYEAIVANKYNADHPKANDITNGVFKGKIN